MCGTGTLSATKVEQTVVADDGVSLPYVDELMVCDACSERLYTPRQSLASSRNRAGALRTHSGYLGPDEIRALRERFGITQAYLEQLLGTGRKTVVRWESGAVCQNATAESSLRLIDKVPGAFEVLAARAGLPVTAVVPVAEPGIDWEPAAKLAIHTLAGTGLLPPTVVARGGARRAGAVRVKESPTVICDSAWEERPQAAANADYASSLEITVYPTEAPGIRLSQIFLEEAHFFHRKDFLSLPVSTPPQPAALNFAFQSGLTKQDKRRAVVRVRATTEAETKPVYQLNVVVTALVEVDVQSPNMPLEQYIATAGVPLLMPFVRQVIASLTGQGRFGPILMQPLNVRAVLESPASPPEIVEPAPSPAPVTRRVALRRALKK
jgi:putative zinc finger/helix-turn-helix YgiT family protein